MDMNNSKNSFTCKMDFVKDITSIPKRYVGVNTLYSRRKNNSYFLLDMEKIFEDDGTPVWTIHTNEKNYDKESNERFFLSDRRNPNIKFVVSQFLTLFFKRQKVIPSSKRNYFYSRIRQLLLVQ